MPSQLQWLNFLVSGTKSPSFFALGKFALVLSGVFHKELVVDFLYSYDQWQVSSLPVCTGTICCSSLCVPADSLLPCAPTITERLAQISTLQRCGIKGPETGPECMLAIPHTSLTAV